MDSDQAAQRIGRVCKSTLSQYDWFVLPGRADRAEEAP